MLAHLCDCHCSGDPAGSRQPGDASELPRRRPRRNQEHPHRQVPGCRSGRAGACERGVERRAGCSVPSPRPGFQIPAGHGGAPRDAGADAPGRARQAGLPLQRRERRTRLRPVLPQLGIGVPPALVLRFVDVLARRPLQASHVPAAAGVRTRGGVSGSGGVGGGARVCVHGARERARLRRVLQGLGVRRSDTLVRRSRRRWTADKHACEGAHARYHMRDPRLWHRVAATHTRLCSAHLHRGLGLNTNLPCAILCPKQYSHAPRRACVTFGSNSTPVL